MLTCFAMSEMKTKPTTADVVTFLEAIEHPTRKADAAALDAIFRSVTGFSPRLWGDSLVGYGRYDYTYASGRSGTFLATGFSHRKSNLSIYIMPGYADLSHILDRLGKHKLGKACLYVNKLADVDTGVLADLIAAGLQDLAHRWDVHPT